MHTLQVGDIIMNVRLQEVCMYLLRRMHERLHIHMCVHIYVRISMYAFMYVWLCMSCISVTISYNFIWLLHNYLVRLYLLAFQG